MWFSALQGLLGATVVTALADGGPVVEVCTAQGMRWMPLTEAPRGDLTAPDTDTPPGLQGLAQPCAWALAHVNVPPAPQVAQRPALRAPVERARLQPDALTLLLPDTSGWILLSAPMRAPPTHAV